MKQLMIGTSGYNYADWKGVFYPEDLPKRLWLPYYSEHFPSVEINATFYGSFKKETFSKWRDQVGDEFTFTLKGSRFITHVKRLITPEEPVERFFTSASGLGTSLSCVLWQFPASFQETDENKERLEHFLSILPRTIRQTVELRHTSWFTESVFTLLNNYSTGFVINDSPHFPRYEKMTGDFVYIRFHGPGALYASKYTEAELEKWARRIKNYRMKYDVYCYFNNDYYGYGIENAQSLMRFLTE